MTSALASTSRIFSDWLDTLWYISWMQSTSRLTWRMRSHGFRAWSDHEGYKYRQPLRIARTRASDLPASSCMWDCRLSGRPSRRCEAAACRNSSSPHVVFTSRSKIRVSLTNYVPVAELPSATRRVAKKDGDNCDAKEPLRNYRSYQSYSHETPRCVGTTLVKRRTTSI